MHKSADIGKLWALIKYLISNSDTTRDFTLGWKNSSQKESKVRYYKQNQALQIFAQNEKFQADEQK